MQSRLVAQIGEIDSKFTVIIHYIAARYKPNIKQSEAARIAQKLFKAKGGPGDDPKVDFLKEIAPSDHEWVAKVYDEYHNVLKLSNAFDFEDLLRTCLEIFKKAPWIPKLVNLQHVLVDEFQDTSELQYSFLKKAFRAAAGCITIVGDPDQAIPGYKVYEWRNADIANFRRMKEGLPNTQELLLEENYRSTGSIVAFSLAIIRQDPKRPKKLLFTSRTPDGPKPVLKQFQDTRDEFIYGDCAILVRTNNQSRKLARVLTEKDIPNRILPDKSRFDSPEANILLAYLHLARDPAYAPLICYVLKDGPPYLADAPKDIFTEFMKTLLWQSIDKNCLLFDALTETCGHIDGHKSWKEERLRQLVLVVNQLQILMDEACTISLLADYLLMIPLVHSQLVGTGD
ncbi:hypothetical protein FRC07_003025 [Ceratobasidium sp. 392]|nr:hypothetical protein FRC07_003025 [Ceratobasidium sp. 392]